MDLDLKDLLKQHDIDPSHVLVLRHTPRPRSGGPFVGDRLDSQIS